MNQKMTLQIKTIDIKALGPGSGFNMCANAVYLPRECPWVFMNIDYFKQFLHFF